MSDGYDLFCFQRLEEAQRVARRTSSSPVDEVTCACAQYLHREGYRDLPVTLMPTSFNVIIKQ